ncbi:MAG: hypothetical protein KDD70_17420 [Bdellovibrionales bacterium]|nr:hypothetical protein [Bdellovibrionales bacterium]
MLERELIAPILLQEIERKREEIDQGLYEPRDSESLVPTPDFEIRNFLDALRESLRPEKLVALIQRGRPTRSS